MRITKDPDAVLPYDVNWADWLEGGDTIAASDWTVPAGLTKVAETETDTKATVWLAGGTVGVDYIITNRITTVAGLTDDRSITIAVKER